MYWSDFERPTYAESIALMERIRQRVIAGDCDGAVLAIEYPPTITLGRSASPLDVLLSESAQQAQGVTVVRSDRGGGVTVHAPGQLVVYPILDLRALKVRTRDFVCGLATITIETLAELGINAASWDAEHPGVWIEGRKIASIGLHVTRGVTSHGLSLNVRPQHESFSWIVACHMPGMTVTSIEENGGDLLALKEMASRWIARLGDRYRLQIEWLPRNRFIDEIIGESVDNGARLNH